MIKKYEAFIVKIQIPLSTNHAQQQVLLYNEDKSLYMHGPAGNEIVKTMNGRPKAFFEAFIGLSALEIVREVPDQGW